MLSRADTRCHVVPRSKEGAWEWVGSSRGARWGHVGLWVERKWTRRIEWLANGHGMEEQCRIDHGSAGQPPYAY